VYYREKIEKAKKSLSGKRDSECIFLLCDLLNRVIIQVLCEQWWRVHDGSRRVVNDEPRSEDIISLISSNIRTVLDEVIRISVE
jgi:hypothetical protein